VSEMREFIVNREGGEVLVGLDAAGRTATIGGGEPVAVDLAPTGERGRFSLLIGARSYEVAVETTSEGQRVWVEGRAYDLQVADPRRPAAAGRRAVRTGTDVRLTTPMPGLVAEVLVAVGDQVTKGQAVAVIEAMKMRNDVRSTRDGVVAQVAVVAGQTVAKGDALVVFAGA
jgi:acetyl-CoA/propionyl-CoA carboxylase biotin carboxyl carrier protein